MINLKQMLVNIASAIVDKPDEVVVAMTEEGDNKINLTLSVAEGDMGKVIGKNGRIAKAIRLLMKAAANSVDKKVTVEIK